MPCPNRTLNVNAKNESKLARKSETFRNQRAADNVETKQEIPKDWSVHHRFKDHANLHSGSCRFVENRRLPKPLSIEMLSPSQRHAGAQCSQAGQHGDRPGSYRQRPARLWCGWWRLNRTAVVKDHGAGILVEF